METNLMQLKELFHLEDQDLRSYSPLTLAYIGDGVYELVIRTILVKKGNCPVNRLIKASSLVSRGAVCNHGSDRGETDTGRIECLPERTECTRCFSDDGKNVQQWQIIVGRPVLRR